MKVIMSGYLLYMLGNYETGIGIVQILIMIMMIMIIMMIKYDWRLLTSVAEVVERLFPVPLQAQLFQKLGRDIHH